MKTRTAYSYIRFSTAEQSLGDSERRQLEKAKAYAAAHGLKLSERSFADRGVSAFHGKHRRNGELKTLLEIIKPGEVLLLEDTDRWSRESPLDALTVLRDHVRSGIEIVFLRTGTRVTEDNFGDMSVIVPNFFSSLLANQESEKKSERIQAVWDQKRADARAGKAARINRLPNWLAWQDGKPLVNEGKAKIVNHIFTLARDGKKIVDIVRQLRREGIPSVSSQQGCEWNTVLVRRILTNRAAMGYYCQADPPVPGVWPAIVDEALFHGAQRALDIQPMDKRPGRKATRSEVNLFTGLATCGHCGRYNLNAHVSGNIYAPRLVCSGAHRGKSDCGHASVPIALVEKSCLSFLANADLIRPLLAGELKPSRLNELEGRLADAQKQVKKLSGFILGDDSPSPTIYERLKLEEAKAVRLRSEIEDEQARERVRQPALLAYNDFCASLPELRADKAKRPALRKAIATVVERLTLDPRPAGEKGRWIYQLKLRGASNPVDVIINSKPEGWLAELRRPESIAGELTGIVMAAA